MPIEDLYSQAALRREVNEQLVAESKQREVEGLTFEPAICGRSKQMAREGYVEDRLIAGWAESMLMREEQAARTFEEEEARIQLESDVHRQAVGTRASLALRQQLEAKDASTPVHDRLYSKAEEQRQKADARANAPPGQSQRWDGSAVPFGSPRLSQKSTIGRPSGAGSALPTGAVPLHDRLHQKGTDKLLREKARPCNGG